MFSVPVWERLQAVEMISVMSSSNDGRAVVEPPERGSSLVGELKASASTSEIGSAGGFGFGTVASSDEAARVGGDGSDETRIYGNASVSRVLKVENEENSFRGSGGGENQPSSSVCKLHGSSKKSGSRSGKLELKKNRSVSEDYDSILSAFDQFAAKGKDEAVEYGFKIGDMVWGKVKSHPWWPGHIYDEAFASPAVRRGKHEGHLLVAFFGDSSYGWFDPEELIPFEENYAEKSRQTTSRSFVKAVEEAVDEIARRSSFGLACRCRNEFNLWPSSAEGYFVVDVGDSETGVYSMDQISKAQESFRPRDLVSFLHEVALKPMNDRCSSIDFVKQKAAALALRKALFEEFDETYAQAFGTQLLRPSRPTAPAAVDPSKALLGGRLVIAEALGKGKILVKPAKTKGQVEDKYLPKRREESIQMKSKKARSSQAVHSPRPVSVDGQYFGIREVMHQASESCFIDGQHQQASIDIKPSESSRKLVEGGTKKVKFPKRPTGESTAENAIHVKKKKRKGLSPETGGELRELRLAVSDSAVAADNISGIPVHVPPIDNNGLEDQKIDASAGVSSSQSQQAVDFAKVELQMLVTDLRVLALNPFHGEQVSCPAVIKQVFLKFRSLVYQKSLVLVPPTESGSSEGNFSRLPPPAVVVSPTDKRLPPLAVVVSPTIKTNDKIARPSVRLDDPTKGGKKRGPSERPEDVQKKKYDVSGVKKKKVDDSLDSKKKKIDNFKSSTLEKKILQRSAESQHGDVKDSAVRVVPSTQPRAVKQESSKRTSQMARAASPTMLVMKFPAGAALPSIPQLKAKFARFGPLDQSGTRVFWKSYTCRLVYQYKIDAQAALKFAVGSSNVFGNANVRCFLREVENEAADSELVKPQKEEDTLYVASQDRESAVEQRVITKMASQPLQPPQSSAQLKSCLKKPCGDEGGNGGGRSGRVKFVLGGKENSKGELLLNENKKNNIASFPQGDSSSSSSSSSMQSVDSSSKILPKLDTFAPSPSPFQQLPPVSSPSSEQGGRPVNPPPAPQTSSANDISQQMLNLLMRCDDVVSNLRAALGCMPYHPL